MSWLSDSTPLISAGWMSSAYAGHGILGGDVPSGGTHGPGLIYPSLSLPADAGKEYRLLIASMPYGLASILIGEDGSVYATGSPGTYTGGVGWLYEDGVLLSGTVTFSIVIGSGSVDVTVAVQESGADTVSAAILVVQAGSIAASMADIESGPDAVAAYADVDASAALDLFMPFVLPRVAGCPWELAQVHVLQACIEWFQRTLTWRVKTFTAASAGLARYPLPLASGTTAVKLMSAWVNGRSVRVLSNAAGAEEAVRRGQAAVWTQDRAAFGVSPTPGGTDVIELMVAVKPAQSAGWIPMVQFEQYADYIAQGALARLLKIKGKKWTDIDGAKDCQDEFEVQVARALEQASRGFGSSEFRVRPSLF